MATYRDLRTDFSAGMLDDMAEGNLMNPNRARGVKKSRNAFHLPQGPVMKRPGCSIMMNRTFKSADDHYEYRYYDAIDLETIYGPVTIIFAYDANYIVYGGKVTRQSFVPNFSFNRNEYLSSNFAVHQVDLYHFDIYETYTLNRSYYTSRDPKLLVHRLDILQGNPPTFNIYMTEITEEELIGWKWGQSHPTACCISAGRLLLGWGNTVIASRTPEDGKYRLLDFTLADFKYKWKLEHNGSINAGDSTDSWKVRIVETCENSTGFTTDIYSYYRVYVTYDKYVVGEEFYHEIWSEDWKKKYESMASNPQAVLEAMYGPGGEGNSAKWVRVSNPNDGEFFRDVPVESLKEPRIENPPINKKYLQKRTKSFLRYEIRIDRNDIEETAKPEYEGQYAWFPIYADDWTSKYLGLSTYGVITKFLGSLNFYIMNCSDNWTNPPSGNEISVSRTKLAGTDSLHKGFGYTVKNNITVEENYSDMELTMIIATSTELKTDMNDKTFIVTIGNAKYPEYIYQKPPKYTYIEDSQETIPTILPSHAIEVNDNDLKGSEIVWIADMGRIVVGTDAAIFISTEDLILPQTFDLRSTAYIPLAPIRPQFMQNYIVFLSKDRNKLYGAIYNNEIRGLQIFEVTKDSRGLFKSGIDSFSIATFPDDAIFMISSNKLYAGNIMVTDSGISFAYSIWDFDIPVDKEYTFKGVHVTPYADNYGDRVFLFCKWSTHSDEDQQVLLDFVYQDLTMTNKNEVNFHRWPLFNLDWWFNAQVVKENDCLSVTIPCGLPIADRYERGVAGIALISGGGYGLTYREIEKIFPYEKDGVTNLRKFKIDIPLKAGERIIEVVIGMPIEFKIETMYPLMPHNAGLSLSSRYSVQEVLLQLYQSNSGEVVFGKNSAKPIIMSEYGEEEYSSWIAWAEYLIENHTLHSGIGKVSAPSAMITKPSGVKVLSKNMYPFCVQALETKYNITEVN